MVLPLFILQGSPWRTIGLPFTRTVELARDGLDYPFVGPGFDPAPRTSLVAGHMGDLALVVEEDRLSTKPEVGTGGKTVAQIGHDHIGYQHQGSACRRQAHVRGQADGDELRPIYVHLPDPP